MPSHDPDQDKPGEEQADQTLTQKVEALQGRVRKMGFVSDESGDKAFMDEAWGEGGRYVGGRDLDSSRPKIDVRMNRCHLT